MAILIETEQKEFMTRKEQALKKKLIALLKDDGRGHKHAKYAERLADFDVKIVPLGQKPETAAISFDKGLIYINEGFLSDPATFFQLNVLMRHEMAHNLLMHQIRMAHQIEDKYGKDGETRIKLSRTLHELMNVIEDFEISNKRYTDEDKHTVRNMYLNGQLIGGLVTEDHRKNWEDMSLESMYEALGEEIETIQQEILDSWAATGSPGFNAGQDYLKHEIGGLYYYAQINRPADFSGSVDDFMQNQALYHFFPFDDRSKNVIQPCIVKLSSLPEEWQNLLKIVYEAYSGPNVTEKMLDDTILEIAKTSPEGPINITDPINGNIIEKLYIPEEKLLVSDLLKALKLTRQDYQTWFDKIQKVLKDPKYSKTDLEDILTSLQKEKK